MCRECCEPCTIRLKLSFRYEVLILYRPLPFTTSTHLTEK